MNHGLIVNYSDSDSEEEEDQKIFEIVQEKPPPAKKIKLPNPLKNIIIELLFLSHMFYFR